MTTATRPAHAARRSATSKTRTDASSGLKAFATLRFEGGGLDVNAVSDLLQVTPTLAYRKGEPYRLGKRGVTKVGETGYWLLNTKDRVDTSDLGDHAACLVHILQPDSADAGARTFDRLAVIIGAAGVSMRVTLFWFGEAGAQPPAVDPRLESLVLKLRGTIEADFATKGRDPERIDVRAA